jgi:hypothetical protein
MDPVLMAAYAGYEAEKQKQTEQQRQSQPNLVDALGKLALGAGAVAAGAYGVRKMLGAGAVAPSKVPPSSADVRRAAGVVPADVARQQRGIELTRQARAERPRGVVQTDLSAIQAAERVLDDPEMKALVKQQLAEEVSEARSYQSKAQAEYRNLLASRAEEVRSAILKEANTTQAAAQEDFAGQYLRNQGYVDVDTLVDQQQRRILGQVDHFANAVNSAEDQATGRTKVAIQRNEDANLAAVEMAEDAVDAQLARMAQQSPETAGAVEVDAAINQAASQLEDGLPVDQAEVVATKPIYTFRERIFEQPGVGIQEKRQQAQQYRTPTPISIIGQYPAAAEGPPSPYVKFPGEFGSSTGEAIVVSPVTPTSGLTNIQRGGVEFTAREARLGSEQRPARFTVLPPGTTTEGRLFTGPSTPTLSAEQIENKLAELQLSREAQVQKAMERGLGIARAKRQPLVTESQREAIEAALPTISSEDVMSRPGMTSYGDVADAERFAEEQASKAGRLQSLEQGGFLEEDVDPGQLRVEPRQARTGVMIRPASKTSYRGMTGRPGVGIYGEQGPGRAGDLDFGAGAVEAKKEIKVEGEERGVTTPRPFIPGVDDPKTRTPEGFVYTEEALTRPTQARGGYPRYGTQPPARPEAAREAFDVARQLRQLQQSGRPEEAQAFLDKMMQERGISALGQSQPLRQQMGRRNKFGA